MMNGAQERPLEVSHKKLSDWNFQKLTVFPLETGIFNWNFKAKNDVLSETSNIML